MVKIGRIFEVITKDGTVGTETIEGRVKSGRRIRRNEKFRRDND